MVTEQRTISAEAPPWAPTVTGKRMSLASPSAEDVDIRDIARALSQACRYAGGAPAWYTVAEHSVRAADLARTCGYGRRIETLALLHDAPEAYTGDVTRPTQCILGPDGRRRLRAVQGRLLEAILRALDVPFGLPEDWRRVRALDDALAAAEIRALWGEDPREWGFVGALEVPRVDLASWPPAVAEEQFLAAWRRLQAEA